MAFRHCRTSTIPMIKSMPAVSFQPRFTHRSIIFVHGLRGHPQGTWEASPETTHGPTKKRKDFIKTIFKSKSDAHVPAEQPNNAAQPSKVFWPKEFLASDIPEAKVWMYGYNADVINSIFQANNQNSISQHGRDLAVKLPRHILGEKPIVFVVHSLGGIIVKDAITELSEAQRSRVKLVLFLGTPHRGSGYADWAKIASNLALLALHGSNKKLTGNLRVNGEVLDRIHNTFKETLYKGGLQVHSFQEARAVTGIAGLDGKVVDDFSSKLDPPKALERVETIDANHMQMARYSKKQDEGYCAISGVIKLFIQENFEVPIAAPEHAAEEPQPKLLFTVSYAKDVGFVERKTIMEKLATTSTRTLGQSHMRSALVGLGAQEYRKSQIAIEHAYRVKQIAHVFWIYASNITRFKQGYKEIADKAQIPRRDDPNVDILQLVCDWMSTEAAGTWLMIVDNADDGRVFFSGEEEAADTAQTTGTPKRPIESFLPHSANGSILFTSRNSTAAANLIEPYNDIIMVGVMTEEEEALELLGDGLTDLPEDDPKKKDAKKLAQALGYLPLAIMHAGRYINRPSSQTTIGDYLHIYEKNGTSRTRLLATTHWQDPRRDYSTRSAVITTWKISFEQNQKDKPSAAHLLGLMSMFDRQGIPSSLPAFNDDELDFLEAIDPLLDFSLIQKDGNGQSFTMHRLVQISMRDWLKAEGQLEAKRSESIKILNEIFPSGDLTTKAQCVPLIPHSREASNHELTNEDDLLELASLLHRVGWYLCETCDYAQAAEFTNRSLTIRENAKSLGRNHISTMNCVSLLGIIYDRQRNHALAETMIRRDLKVRESELGLEDTSTLLCMRNLAWVLQHQSKYDEAKDLSERCLQGLEKVLGRNHPHTLCTVSSIGALLEAQGNIEEAEAIQRRALAGLEETLEPDDPAILDVVRDLARLLNYRALPSNEEVARKRDLEESEELYWRDLRACEKHRGPDHWDTLTRVHDLAFMFHNRKQYSEARPLYERAYSGYKRLLGVEHASTIRYKKRYDKLLREMRKAEESREQKAR